MSETVSDYNGNPLAEGAHVEAWRDGVRYLATVKEIRRRLASDGDIRRITLVRDDDCREVQSFSDAVSVITSEEGPQ
jgi:hypothetical protein